MELTREMRNLLIAFISNKAIVASWGIRNITIEETKLSFEVSGFNYHGNVEVNVHGNNYNVIIGDEDLGVLHIDEVLTVLDDKIEHTQDYYNDLEQWILEQGI